MQVTLCHSLHHYAILNDQIAFILWVSMSSLILYLPVEDAIQKQVARYTLQVLAIVYTHMHSFLFATGACCCKSETAVLQRC